MKIRTLLISLAIGLLTGLSTQGFADDIEVYMNTVEAGTYHPNVLFVMDNTDSMKWGGTQKQLPDPEKGELSRFETMKQALTNVLDSLENINVGIANFASPPKNGTQHANVPIDYPVTPIDTFSEFDIIPYVCHRYRSNEEQHETLKNVLYSEYANQIHMTKNDGKRDTFGPCIEDYFKDNGQLKDNLPLYSGFGTKNPNNTNRSCNQQNNHIPICHATGSGTNPYNLICPNQNSLSAHLNHQNYGDSIAPNYAVSDDDCLLKKIPSNDLKLIVANMEMRYGTPIVDALYEANQYFFGKAVVYGKKTYGINKNSLSNPNSYTGGTVNSNGKQITGTPTYISPIQHQCQPNHIVFLTDGRAQSNESVNKIQTLIGKTDCRNDPEEKAYFDTKKDQKRNDDRDEEQECGIALAHYMNEKHNYQLDTDGDGTLETINTNVKIHTIAFNIGSTDSLDIDARIYLETMAEVGGGTFHSANSVNELEDVFQSIVVTAMTDSASFAAPGVSVNRFNKQYHNNEVYFALFKPETTERWNGNIKKYTIDGTTGKLLDVNGDVATEDGDQGLLDTAQSYWSSAADGATIAKGGAGEKLVEATSSRKIYTVCNGSTGAVTSLDAVSSCTTQFTTEQINWIYGTDVNDEDEDGATTDKRWMISDPLHSSPQSIQYTPASEQDDGTVIPAVTKLFVGTNDGMIRMIDAETGTEDWAFLPSELFSKQAAMMTNATDDGSHHIYGMDATPAFWIHDEGTTGIGGSNDFVKMYIGMRRGGSNLYALDVTKISNPPKPKQDWVIKGGNGDFAKLGQTWSFPKPVVVDKHYCSEAAQLYKNKYCVVLLFGGGYDESQDTYFDTSSTVGNAIYMVSAITGERLWWASSDNSADLGLTDMNYPIPSDLKLLDTSGEKNIDRIDVGDVGGQVWRIDLFPESEAKETKGSGSRMIASISNTSSSSDQRRFFYKPERYPYQHGDLIMITSGNQADPLSTSVVNRFYVIYDIGWWEKNANGGFKYENGAKIPNPTITESNLVDIDHPGDATDYFELVPEGNKGWYLTLPHPGEKGTSSPTIAYKDQKPIVFFTTYTPPETASDNCNYQAGKSRLYALDFLTGEAAFDTNGTGDKEGTDFIDTDDKSNIDASDRSIVLQNGYVAGAQKLNLQNGSLILSGYKTVPVDPSKPAGKAYWTPIEE